MTPPEVCWMDLVDYVLLIDSQYSKAKAAGLSRIDVKWGKWSRQMNLELRERIEAHDPEEPKLKLIVVYWTMRSQLLELHAKKSVFGASKKKRLAREIKQMRTLILKGDHPPELSDEDFMGRVLAAVGLQDKKGLI